MTSRRPSRYLSRHLSPLFSAIIGALSVIVFQSLTTHPSPSHTPISHSLPSPLIIVAAGLPRTGSTWVYNILRILARTRDPNSISGWYADLINIWRNHNTHRYDHMHQSWLSAYQSLRTSLVLKMHGPAPFTHFSKGRQLSAAHLTVMTHRDLRTEVRSWVYQNFNASIHAGLVAETPFVNPAEWVRVAKHVLWERNKTLESIGGGRYLDVRYEDWNGKSVVQQLPVVRRIAEQLDWQYSEQQLLDAAGEAARLVPPPSSALLMYNPVNKLHPGHSRLDAKDPAFINALSIGFRAIENDPQSRAFLQSHHYLS